MIPLLRCWCGFVGEVKKDANHEHLQKPLEQFSQRPEQGYMMHKVVGLEELTAAVKKLTIVLEEKK